MQQSGEEQKPLPPKPARFVRGIAIIPPKKSKIAELIEYALADKTNEEKIINFGNVPNQQGQEINQKTKIKVNGALKILSSYQIKHILDGHSEEAEKLEGRGQKGVCNEDFELIPQILSNPDLVENGYTWRRKPVIKFFKKINKCIYVLLAAYSIKQHTLEVFTLYIKK